MQTREAVGQLLSTRQMSERRAAERNAEPLALRRPASVRSLPVGSRSSPPARDAGLSDAISLRGALQQNEDVEERSSVAFHDG